MRFPKPNNIVAEKYVAGLSLFKKNQQRLNLSANESALALVLKQENNTTEVSKTLQDIQTQMETFKKYAS